MKEILQLLQRVGTDHGVRIVCACESGSRPWGFASPDRDFDIRFLFVRPEKSYLSVRDGLESIDLPLEGELVPGDSKSLMHTLRLLDMAGEIAREGALRIRRPNRDFLLRTGEFDYEELVSRAETQLEEVNAAFEASLLPDHPDRGEVNGLLVEIREEF